MRTSGINTILIDCDGLLADTETLFVEVIEEVCKRRGIAVTPEQLECCIGRTTFEAYTEILGIKDEEVIRQHSSVYNEILANGVQDFPGAKELPHLLQAKGYKTGLVSGSTRHQIDLIIKHLSLKSATDTIVTCEDVKRGKPAPNGYLLAANILNAHPKQCLVLEDATAGIDAAKAAKMRCIAVRNKQMQHEKLLERADNIVNTLAELQALLQRGIPPNDWLLYKIKKLRAEEYLPWLEGVRSA